ncbi:MAG: flagellar basal body rod protein FlgF [Gammaproteobacteria bacterium]|nr:flagellar basal body rod protein FlgF [Gammaproteobacteria bacterium]
MDKLVYIAMTGASQTMLGQASNSHNMANANTTGFRADLAQFRSMPVLGGEVPSRVYAMQERPGADLSPGVLRTTDRALDVAVDGDGWLVVQSRYGAPGLTRAGDLRVATDTGLLETGAGHLVLGDGGPMVLPPNEAVQIASDGQLSFRPPGAAADEFIQLDRIQLVNPPMDQLTKSADGLFRLKDGGAFAPDASVRVVSGALEGSNVNLVDGLVEMISLARQFEMQVRMMRMAEDLASQSARIMDLS